MTASISWILSVYPVLARRRQLAREITLLSRDGSRLNAVAGPEEPAALEGLMLSVAEQVIAVRSDLEQFPITYYFHPSTRDSALALALAPVVDIARWGQQHGAGSVRLQSTLLLSAIDDLAMYVAETFLDHPGDDLGDVISAYAADHLYQENQPDDVTSD